MQSTHTARCLHRYTPARTTWSRDLAAARCRAWHASVHTMASATGYNTRLLPIKPPSCDHSTTAANWCWPANCCSAAHERRPEHTHSQPQRISLLRTNHQRQYAWSNSRQLLGPIGSLLTISSTFNSLFKVLCIFRSRYLFAIGLSPIFSFRWNLPPNLGLYSQTTRLVETLTLLDTHWCYHDRLRGSHPLWRPFPGDFDRGGAWTTLSRLQCVNRRPTTLKAWAVPSSLAVTRGILVSFFSSAYWYA